MEIVEAIPRIISGFHPGHVFGLLGSSNAAWVSHGVEAGLLQFHRTRHESTAVSAASGYARATGQLGIATTTLGPGFGNCLNALAAAVRDHLPVLVITGKTPTSKSYGMQNIGQEALSSALGAGYWTLEQPAELPALMREAKRQAMHCGVPQVVAIDEAMVDRQVSFDGSEHLIKDDDSADEIGPVGTDAAARVLDTASHPLVLVGWGAVRAGCRREVERIADLTGAAVATTLNAKGYFEGHPRNLGVCGTTAPREIITVLEMTDAVISVGASLNGYTTIGDTLFAKAQIIQCEIDTAAEFKASNPELGLLGDPRRTLQSLAVSLESLGGPRDRNESVLPTPVGARASLAAQAAERRSGPDGGLDLVEVALRLNEALPADRVIVCDAGRTQHPLPKLLDVQDEFSWINSRGHSAVGMGLGAALGAAVGHKDRPVVLMVGDGGFMMAAQELDAFRLNQEDVTIVILNDEQYGSEVKYVNRFQLPHSQIRQSMPEIATLAAAYGARYVPVVNLHDLDHIYRPGGGITIAEVAIAKETDWSAV